MNFKKIIQSTNQIKDCYKNNLNALSKNEQSRISLTQNSNCEGSINLDECLKNEHPNENRWDYLFCYNSKIYYVEFHPAKTKEVSVVLKKLAWLKTFLNTLPNLKKLSAQKPYYWIYENRNNILPRSRQHKELAKSGLLLLRQLEL